MTEPTPPVQPTDDAARRRPAQPRRHAAPSTPRARPPLELARRIVELAEDKKAADIVLLDLPR